MDFAMTVMADDQRLAVHGNHSHNPIRFGLASRPAFLQVFELPNVMNFTVCSRPAEFTCVRLKTLNEV